jgi:5-(carboxyamino)imidazole ribonucleotide mutase
MAIGTAGATNAGLFAVGILASRDAALRAKLQAYRDARAQAVREETLE